MTTYLTMEDAISRGYGTERTFKCPVHDDRVASARVNVEKGVWYCHACGAKGKVGGHAEIDPEHLLEEIERISEEKRIYPESWLDLYDSPDDEYWTGRFTKEAIVQFRLGRDRGKNVPTYPLRDPLGRVLGVVSRNTDGPKYKYPRGVKTSELLFNYDISRHDPYPILVEGAMDVIAVWEAGYTAYGCFSAALYDGQLDLLAKQNPAIVFLAYDMDRAGKAARIAATEKLGQMGILSYSLEWDDTYKDFGEMPVEMRVAILQSVVPSTK